MKSKVWHIIGDKRAGGSNHFVKQLVVSRLRDRFAFLVLRLEEARALLKTEKPDLIVFHYPCAWKYLWDLVYFKTKSPLFICEHHYCQGFEADQVHSRMRFRWLLRIAYGIANGVVSVSQAQCQWMLAAHLVNPRKVRVITPASRVENLLTLPAKFPSSPLILGAYGRFARQKGFDRLLKVMAQLPSEKFQLLLGGYGPDEAILQQLAENLPQVQMVGTIGDVAQFLSRCHGVVIPSRWEPWGLVCLEAKAAGKAVLVAAVDGLPEQVQGCGEVIPLNDLDAWKDAIAALAEQDLITWGKNGRASVVNAWENCLDHWEAFLGDVTM
ncbi:group 1 glycosyl transferase [Neosynechococcus sphagnicola sy1]|uniref:Group 1 glycosyl transferase n=1 Tax=Neosynechococcus sphagnicola sy1 TaxID=1497020 RepID=A0A098TLV0_9CYAN|nr:glycosyltransferase family 4 protein [Neosynechococcus sphagnicola]KGF73236.1 group 1 glycosyl transferase [Neosynechococcus sphagnicola sy1]